MKQPRNGASRRGHRAALVAAMIASAVAGSIHAAAAIEHSGDRTLLWLFALCALIQVGWTAAAAFRPTRAVVLAGAGFNVLAFGFWLLSRTAGVWFISALRVREEVGRQDLASAALAVVVVAAGAVVVARPVAKRVLPARSSITVGLAALALFAPVLTAGHTHATGHEHLVTSATGRVEVALHDDAHSSTAPSSSDVVGPSIESVAAPDDGPGDVLPPPPSTPHNHLSPTSSSSSSAPTTTVPGDPPTTTIPGPTGPIISLDDPRLTPAQRAAAVKLIDDTRAGMAAFPTVAAVEAAGYTSIGDLSAEGYEHYIKWSYLADAYEVDPTHIESIVVQTSSTGEKTVVSAMYILTLGKTMAQVPDIAGDLTMWHYHSNLCFDGTKLVGVTRPDGSCAVGSLVVTPPMMHVWMVDQPCGPFAGIGDHGLDCRES